MSGVPVRLVERGEGRVISLDCVEHHITVRRNVFTKSVPITGQRIGADANLVAASIKMVCLLRDDDCSAADLIAQKATSFIDFSSTSSGANLYAGTGSNQLLSSWADLNGARFEFRASDGTNYTATFDTSATNHNSNNPLNLIVGCKALADAGAGPKGSEIASRLKGALEHNTGNANRFLTRFSVTAVDGLKGPVISLTNEKQTRLNFTQLTAGLSGNTSTPVFIAPTQENLAGSNALGDTTLEAPLLQIFTGGSENTCRSAGDKAQDLLANVVNSNFTGLSGNVLGGSLLGVDLGDEKSLVDRIDFVEGLSHKDYVLGLQMPYQSLTQANLGTVGDPIQGYEPRNFLFVTGHAKTEQQGSSANDEPASAVFDPTNKYTGIHGCITECNISYIAGDTTYSADITFQPIDMIMGI
tara:strand:+ start:5372 stop:6613 length:1242 start_codon:yes stop_codon:yes gene_type:complete